MSSALRIQRLVHHVAGGARARGGAEAEASTTSAQSQGLCVTTEVVRRARERVYDPITSIPQRRPGEA